MAIALEIALIAVALGFLWFVISFIRGHRADDPEMDPLWFALGPLAWLIHSGRRPPRGPGGTV